MYSDFEVVSLRKFFNFFLSVIFIIIDFFLNIEYLNIINER